MCLLLVCEPVTFGQDCAYKCNTTCLGCNNENGLCETGCSPGWKGAYCHEGCIKLRNIILIRQKNSFGISKIKLFYMYLNTQV